MSRRKTDKEFVNEVYELVGEEYGVLGEYKSNKAKIKMKHNICQNEWDTSTPSNFLKGNRCPKCASKMKKHDDFIKEVFALVGNEYGVLGEYKGNKTKIKMKHNVCGYEWAIVPDSFIRGNRCYKCSGKMKKTHEKFIREVSELVGNEHEVLGEYINSSTKIKMKHNVCGYEFDVLPTDFISKGSRCSNCAGNIKKSTDEFIREVFDLVGNEYIVLGKYMGNNKTKIKMKHNTCGYEWHVRPNDFISGYRCLKCAGNERKVTDIFRKEVFKLVGNEHEVLGEYVNSSTKIKMKHNICGNEIYVRPGDFLSKKSRCPKCKESKGEKRISEFLKMNNIEYLPQYKFDDCKYRKVLPFDFGIIYNGDLVMLIEFDGRQHFENNDFFGGYSEFNEVQKRDVIKNEYCRKNNIKLVRISYLDIDTIEEILIKELGI